MAPEPPTDGGSIRQLRRSYRVLVVELALGVGNDTFSRK
jgi:hypothetical protein